MRKKYLLYFSLLFILFIILSLFIYFVYGIARKIELNEVYGKYVIEHKFAKEQLEIFEDGTYIQTIWDKKMTGPTTTYGKWDLMLDSDINRINFSKGYMIVIDFSGNYNPDYQKKGSSGMSVNIFSLFGNIRIGLTEGLSYKKVE